MGSCSSERIYLLGGWAEGMGPQRVNRASLARSVVSSGGLSTSDAMCRVAGEGSPVTRCLWLPAVSCEPQAPKPSPLGIAVLHSSTLGVALPIYPVQKEISQSRQPVSIATGPTYFPIRRSSGAALWGRRGPHMPSLLWLTQACKCPFSRKAYALIHAIQSGRIVPTPAAQGGDTQRFTWHDIPKETRCLGGGRHGPWRPAEQREIWRLLSSNRGCCPEITQAFIPGSPAGPQVNGKVQAEQFW